MAEALASFRESYEINHDASILYNIGRTLEALGRFSESITAYEEFEAKAPESAKSRVPNLRQVILEVRAKVSTLTVTTNTPGARVLVRKVEVGKSPLNALRLNAGDADIEVLADGYEPYTTKVNLPGGGSKTLKVDLVAKPREKAPAPPPPAPSPPAPAPSSEGGSTWWIWAGVGAVVIGGAVLTFALLKEQSPREGNMGANSTGQYQAPLIKF